MKFFSEKLMVNWKGKLICSAIYETYLTKDFFINVASERKKSVEKSAMTELQILFLISNSWLTCTKQSKLFKCICLDTLFHGNMKDFEIASKRIRFMFLVTVIHANNINMTIIALRKCFVYFCLSMHMVKVGITENKVRRLIRK